MARWCCILVLAACLALGHSVKLPSYYQRCRVSPKLDNKPNECLREAILNAIADLSKEGNKELGALDYDPLDIEQIVVDHGGDRPVSIKLVFSKNQVHGLGGAGSIKVTGKLSSPKDFKMRISYENNRVEQVGDYEISGRVLVLPIRGKGKSNMTLIGLSGALDLSGQPSIRNGKEYLEITDSKLTMDLKRLYFQFENLFGGNKELGDNMNKFLNENWDEIYKELRGSIENAFGQVLGAYAKRILERVQFKNIFILD